MSKLYAAGNRLMIYSYSDEALEKIKVTKAYEIFGEQYIFPSSPIFGASLEEDWQAAEKRVAELYKYRLSQSDMVSYFFLRKHS